MINVKIIRHSERLDYKYPWYWSICFGQYLSDSPLTSYGHNLAELKGKELLHSGFSPKYIYTSPYNRTMATATAIQTSFSQAKLIIEPLLSEYQKYYKHTVAIYPKGIPTTYRGEPTEFVYPEKYDQFTKRVQFILDKLFERNADFCVVTHGEILRAFVGYLQHQYPNILLDGKNIPYLTILSFKYDTVNKIIEENSVRLERDEKILSKSLLSVDPDAEADTE